MEKLTYQLEAFEGPLDLLLYLIRKDKLNICDIPIAEVLDQYMAQINAAKAENMDVASEFLEMATRLVYIKTVYLLPKHEEADQMKAELSGQLLEYEECKHIAALLKEKFQMDYFVRVPEEIEPDYTYRRRHLPEELYTAYINTLGKKQIPQKPSQESFSEIVSHRIVSVASQIVFVLRSLWKKSQMPYRELFVHRNDRSELVATFLAVLELVRGKRIRVDGDDDSASVTIVKERKRVPWKNKI